MVIERQEHPLKKAAILTAKIESLKEYRRDLLAGKIELPSRYRVETPDRENEASQGNRASTYTQRLSEAIGRLEETRTHYENQSPSLRRKGPQLGPERSAPLMSWDERIKQNTPFGKADFEIVYKEFENKILAYISRLVNNPEQAKELAQDAFEKAYRTFNGGKTITVANVRAWIYRIATNTAFDALRRRKVIDWTPLTFDFKEDNEHSAEVLPIGYENNLLEKSVEDRELIEKVLRRMSPQYVQCIHLYFEQGFSMKELAEILDVSEPAAKMKASRARRQFKAIYAQQLQESA